MTKLNCSLYAAYDDVLLNGGTLNLPQDKIHKTTEVLETLWAIFFFSFLMFLMTELRHFSYSANWLPWESSLSCTRRISPSLYHWQLSVSVPEVSSVILHIGGPIPLDTGPVPLDAEPVTQLLGWIQTNLQLRRSLQSSHLSCLPSNFNSVLFLPWHHWYLSYLSLETPSVMTIL